MANSRKVVSLLPVVNQTNTLQQFFGATVDHLFQPGSADLLSGYIGQRPSYYDVDKDYYISEPSQERSAYQLEPSMVSAQADGTITDALFYTDLVNQLRFQGANVGDHSRLFENDYYSWCPPVDLDKLMNYRKYFWINDSDQLASITHTIYGYRATGLGDGFRRDFVLGDTLDFSTITYVPGSASVVVLVSGTVVHNYGLTLTPNDVVVDFTDPPTEGAMIEMYLNSNFDDEIIGQPNYTFPDGLTLSSGMRLTIMNDATSAYNGKSYIVEGVGDSIRIVEDTDVSNEGPQYLVLERGCTDHNPWSKVNRWFHEDVLNGQAQNLTAQAATRPIVEFRADLKLFKYGRNRRPAVNAVFNSPAPNNDLFGQLINQPLGTTYLNGRALKAGDRVLVTTASDASLNNRIFKVNNNGGQIALTLEIDEPTCLGIAQEGDIVEIAKDYIVEGFDGFAWDDLGDWDTIGTWEPVYTVGASEFYFDGTTWSPAQMRTDDQQAPLFDLHDNNGTNLADPGVYPNSTFQGNRLFGYALDNNNPITDAVFGVALKYDSYGQFVFANYLANDRYTFEGGNIEGFYYHCHLGTQIDENTGLPVPLDTYSNDWHLIEQPTAQMQDENGFYDIPLNLRANPDNEHVDFISRNQWFDHFSHILTNQVGFSGTAFSNNNYRDTKRAYNIGVVNGSSPKILQHRAPLLKTMLLACNSNIDFMLASRYVGHEYARFYNKFLTKIDEFYRNGMLLDTDAPSTWVAKILTALKLTKNAEFPFWLSGMVGLNNFIPATAAFLGITPAWQPQIFLDDTYGSELFLIRCHDGSLIPAKNDFRDNIVLELENQIYASIDASLKTGTRPVFDTIKYMTGKYRKADYSRAEVTQMLRPMFDRWSAQNGLDYRANNGFDPTNGFTFNYVGMTDKDGEPVPGHWRGIYNHYYDTDRPHTHPWEMLGFASKPAYWDGRYGPAPYTAGNSILWNDLEQGSIAGGVRQGVDPLFARPGLSRVIPVDESGRLLNPVQAGIVQAPTLQTAMTPWDFGDGAPVETAWRSSNAYPFALAQLGYLMKPARFIEECWDTVNTKLANGDQWTDGLLGTRPRSAGLVVHGEGTAINPVIIIGVQQWIADYVVSNGQSVTTMFGDRIRGLGVRLAHKMGGFSSTDNLAVYADNISGPIPSENIELRYYQSRSVREDVYSGVVIEWVGNGWRVYGYDVLKPSFTTIPADPNGQKYRISIAETDPPVVVPWRPNVNYALNIYVSYNDKIFRCIKAHVSSTVFEQKYWAEDSVAGVDPSSYVLKYTSPLNDTEEVPYGTFFQTRQQVADFLFGYERFLESRGWLFENVDSDNLTTYDYTRAFKEFLVWANIQWDAGNFIALSPLAEGAKYQTSDGIVQNIEQLINGVYPILDRSGRPIDARSTYINRLDDTISIVPQNDNIFAVRLYVTEIEHVVIFDNTTIFNDIIYQPLFDLRQPRLRFVGLRTQDWNGRLDAPGFMVTDNTIVPNFEKSVDDIRRMFEIESNDNKTFTDYARHNIGYQSRDYLRNFLFTETPQFEFYQGMVQQKGAPGVFNKLLRSDFIEQGRDILFFEEWAFKIGEYGATDVSDSIEFLLPQSLVRRDPQLIQFLQDTDAPTISDPSTLDDPYDDRIQLYDEVDESGTLITPDPRWIRRPKDELTVFAYRDSYAKARNDLPTAGYVRTDEVTYNVLSIDQLGDLYDSLDSQNIRFQLGDRIWVYNNGKDGWDVRRVCVAAQSSASANQVVTTSIDPNGTVLTFAAAHGLGAGDQFVIDGLTRSQPDWGGVNTVVSVSAPNQVLIAGYTIKPYDYSDHVTDNKNSDPAPSAFVFRSVRFAASPTNFVPADGWQVGDLVYFDDDGTGTWAVKRCTATPATFATVRTQPKKLDTSKVQNGLIYSRATSILDDSLYAQPTKLDRIMCFDPVGGLIPGQAEREIWYKLEYDPAIYNMGAAAEDGGNTWDDIQIGRLWWDLSTVRFLETELNDLSTLSGSAYDAEMAYRVANWGRLAPNTTIDIYEWTRSTVAPSDWASKVQNATGNEAETYSGEVLNADNPSWVERQEYDATAGHDVTFYYFWVKNKIAVPQLSFRKLAALDVAQILTNPTSAGISWLCPVAPNGFLVSGVLDALDDTDTVLQVTIKNTAYDGNIHREYVLLREGDDSSLPPEQLWTKMRDSLVGRDLLGQRVPDPKLHPSRQFGTLLRPRQSWYTDLLKAREAFVNGVNVMFAGVNLLDTQPDFAALLTATTPIDPTLIFVKPSDSRIVQPLPIGGHTLSDGSYDPADEWNVQVRTLGERDALSVPDGTRVLVNGLNQSTPQWSVWLKASSDANADAAGYVIAPTYDQHVTSISARNALPSLARGTRVLVDGTTVSNGFWQLYVYLPHDDRADSAGFVLLRTQTYRTADFWSLTDWFDPNYPSSNPPVQSYPSISARNVALNGDSPLFDFVKVDDDGTGHWIWTAYQDGQWVTVAKQNATVMLSGTFYDGSKVEYGFDDFTLSDIANRNGSHELRILTDILRDGVFSAFQVNKCFFGMVKYVHAEQDQVDWAFKTSFMYISGYNEPLDQVPVQTADNTANFLSYIDEVKPYHVKVRDFVRRLSPPVDVANVFATDFDKPVYFEKAQNKFRVLDVNNANDALIVQTTEPWKSWYLNYTKTNYDSSESGYDSNFNPVRRMKITLTFDRVSCFANYNQYSKAGDEGVWDHDAFDMDLFDRDVGIDYGDSVFGTEMYEAERIKSYYHPLPGMPTPQPSDSDPDGIGVLISGCVASATVVDGGYLDMDGDFDDTVDGSELDGSDSPDVALDGGGFIVPGGPEERVTSKVFDPFYIDVYQGWIAGAPQQHIAHYITDGSASYAIGILPQSVEAVAVFVADIRLTLGTDYTVDFVEQTISFLSSVPNGETLSIHSFGMAGLGAIDEQIIELGDGSTTRFLTQQATITSQTHVIATINGVLTNAFTTTAGSVTFIDAPTSGAHVMITILADPPTLVRHQLFSSGSGPNQTFSITNPSISTIPAEATTIVEVNGERLTPPGIYYVTLTPDNLIVILDQTPTDVSQVKVWFGNSPGVVGTASTWTQVSDIDLNNVPPTTPANANVVLVENELVVVNLQIGSGSGFDTIGWDQFIFDDNGVSTALDMIAMVSVDNDFNISGSTLTIHKSLALGSQVGVTSFVNDELMGTKTYTYLGASNGQYAINENPFDSNYLWVTLNGQRLTEGLDYTLYDNTHSWDEYAFDSDSWDSQLSQHVVGLNTTQISTDRVVITVFAGDPIRAPMAWRGFTDVTGTREFIRLSDGHRTRLSAAVNEADTTITVKANPRIPTAFLPANVLGVPSVEQNIPGIVWIGAERIEYFTLTQNDARSWTLGSIRRGTRGTAKGVPDVRLNAVIRGDGITRKYYVPMDTTDNIEVYQAKYRTIETPEEILAQYGWDMVAWDTTGWDIFTVPDDVGVQSVAYHNGYEFMVPGKDYTVHQDDGGVYVLLSEGSPVVPDFLISYDNGVDATNFCNLMIIQRVSDSMTTTMDYAVNTLVFNGSRSEQFSSTETGVPVQVTGWGSIDWGDFQLDEEGTSTTYIVDFDNPTITFLQAAPGTYEAS